MPAKTAPAAPPPHQLTRYAQAGYPAVAVATFEETRLVSEIMAAFPGREVLSIAAAGGLKNERTLKQVSPTAGYREAWQAAISKEAQILVVMDLQHIISGPAGYRPLLQALPAAKSQGCLIVLVAPAWSMPAELVHEIPVISIALPTAAELAAPLAVVTEATEKTLEGEQAAELCGAARGLTTAEAENAYALAALDGFTPATVETEKMRQVKSQCMSVERPADPASLGGLGRLKDYVTAEVLTSRDDDTLRVRGILLVGVPGTGKSLAAKVAAALLRWPLVRLDIGAAKGSLVGQSESNLRQALATADAIAPCVLWLDEIEKAVGGHASSAQTDGGTTLSMVGALLTWMQEHTSPVIVVATCNDYQKLPAELTRAGRFDERFFLDLPTAGERAAIAEVHLKRFSVTVDGLPAKVAEVTNDFTGAEIEQVIRSAARRTRREITPEAISQAAAEIIPISKHSKVQDLRAWAQDHLRPANDAPDQAPATARRIGSKSWQK